MFSIRVHQPNVEGHRMHECLTYELKPTRNGVSIIMELRDGSKKTVDVMTGGEAYVMNDFGKTVDQVRLGSPRTAQMRGGR